MRPIHITAAAAAKKILAAHAAGLLTAQIPLGAERKNLYQWTKPRDYGPAASYFEQAGGKTYRCAIGQLMLKADALDMQCGEHSNYMLADRLIEEDLLVVDNPAWFITAQNKHDNWANRPEDTYEQAFLAHVRSALA